MNIQPASGASRNLPVFACIRHTLNSVLRYRAAAFRIAMPWIIILTLANLAISFSGGSLKTPASLNDITAGDAVRELVLFAISMVGASSIAVNWHRYILLDETPGSMAEILRLDATVWRYAAFTLITLLVLLLPMLLFAIVSAAMAPFMFIAIIGIVVAAVVMLRLSLVLPAIALQRGGFGFNDALAATKGQMLPLAGLLIANAALIIALLLGFALLLLIANALPSPINILFTAVMALAINLALAVYSVSLLSSLYGFYVEKRDF